MDLTIGVQHVARHLTIDVDDAEAALAAIETALKDGDKTIVITDSKGGKVLLPTAGIGYVHADPQEQRPVGFGRA